jgi:hypothetical protein
MNDLLKRLRWQLQDEMDEEARQYRNGWSEMSGEAQAKFLDLYIDAMTNVELLERLGKLKE